MRQNNISIIALNQCYIAVLVYYEIPLSTMLDSFKKCVSAFSIGT